MPANQSVFAPPRHVNAPRRVLLANPRGFCAGVERAINTVEATLAQHGAPVFVRRAIVHNAEVVARLERRGAVFVQEITEIPPGSVTILSAHGSAKSVQADARRRQLRVVDAVCPLVAKVHAEVIAAHRAGRHILLIGHPGHPEIVGTLGQLPAGAATVITRPDALELPELARETPVAYAVQTTFAASDANRLIAAINARFTDVRGPRSSDICYATTNRQRAIEAIARHSDLVLVVGDLMSSNAQRLVEVGAAAGSCPAVLVAQVADLPLDLVDRAQTIGLTAAASAPESAVLRVCHALADRGFVLIESEGLREAVRFKPVELANL